jgi:3-deoxy-D-manno-octulosonic-acid transferase
MGYIFYNLILTAGFFLGLPFLPLMLLLGWHYRQGIAQRLGFYPSKRIAILAGSRPIWIHAASVGEVRSAVHLVGKFKSRWPARKILLTTFTASGNRLAKEISGADCVLFFPLDLYWIVRRALRRIDPAILIIVETEIWPNLLRETYRKGVPTVLLSGRLSQRAFKRYSRCAWFFRRVVAYFTVMGMQSTEDAQRMIRLGADATRVSTVGSLKHFSSNGERPELALPGSGGEKPQGPPLLVIGSSHRGEEEMVLQAFLTLRGEFPDLQMVLAPRHPQRFLEVAKLLQFMGLPFEKRSDSNGRRQFAAAVMLLDTIGDLLDFYAMGDIAFVGGSLIDAGGHNLLEPASFGKPVLFGPFTANYRAIAEQLKQKGAGVEVHSVEDLIREITSLLNDPQKRIGMGAKALEVAAADHQVLDRNVDLAAGYIIQ